MISAKRRTKKINDQTESENEENQIAIIACYAIDKILIKQRRLNTTEARGENFIVDNTASEKVDFAIINDETVKRIDVVNIANDATNEKDVNVATALNAVNEKEQISLTNLL